VRDLHKGARRAGVVEEGLPVQVLLEGLRPPHHQHGHAAPGQAHVHAPNVRQKADASLPPRPDAGKEDDVLLLPLATVHSVQFDLLLVGGAQGAGKLSVELHQLGLVRRDHSHLAPHPLPLGFSPQGLIHVDQEPCFGAVPVGESSPSLPALVPPSASVTLEVEEGERLKGGERVPGSGVSGREDVLAVLEEFSVEIPPGEGGNGRVHPVLGVEEVDRMAPVLQTLEKGALEGRGGAQGGKDRGRKLLGVADQDTGLRPRLEGDEGGGFNGLRGLIHNHHREPGPRGDAGGTRRVQGGQDDVRRVAYVGFQLRPQSFRAGPRAHPEETHLPPPNLQAQVFDLLDQARHFPAIGLVGTQLLQPPSRQTLPSLPPSQGRQRGEILGRLARLRGEEDDRPRVLHPGVPSVGQDSPSLPPALPHRLDQLPVTVPRQDQGLSQSGQVAPALQTPILEALVRFQ
jgi:hypothetical protein